MTDWGAFAGFAGVVVLLLLLLARASQSALSPSPPEDPPVDGDFTSGPAAREGTEGGTPRAVTEAGTTREGPPADAAGGTGTEPGAPGHRATPAEETLAGAPAFGTAELLANVLLTHGLFAALVAGAAVYWAVPPAALGVAVPTAGTVAWGLAAGVALYLANEAGAAAAARFGVDHDERLRALLAPETPTGWAALLGVVLPVVAVAEELIFRAVLVGAFAAGFGVSPWLLAAGSSVAFALGHGAQGRGGVVVTGLLGFALAAAFVVTGSLALVVVAHYVVNALEFGVHEGLGVEWP